MMNINSHINKSISLAVVIVTFNRLEKLKHALSCYDDQTTTFAHIIVVDNNSSDGTKEFLSLWKDEPSSCIKHVLSMDRNVGGAGGFSAGQIYAMDLNVGWVFLADDDAYPAKDMISVFYDYVGKNDTTDIAAVCTSVLHPDGSYSIDHRRIIKRRRLFFFNLVNSTNEDYSNGPFYIDTLSYVGSFIKIDAMKQVGPVNKDCFIYVDDVEHSLRLRKVGKIVTVPNAVIVHDSGVGDVKTDANIVIDWRDYYYRRNLLNMLLRHKHWLTMLYIALSFLNEARKYRNKEHRKMIMTAVCDGVANHLGVHSLYKPGWKINKKIEIR